MPPMRVWVPKSEGGIRGAPEFNHAPLTTHGNDHAGLTLENQIKTCGLHLQHVYVFHWNAHLRHSIGFALAYPTSPCPSWNLHGRRLTSSTKTVLTLKQAAYPQLDFGRGVSENDTW